MTEPGVSANRPSETFDLSVSRRAFMKAAGAAAGSAAVAPGCALGPNKACCLQSHYAWRYRLGHDGTRQHEIISQLR